MEMVLGVNVLVWVDYIYWMLGYVISLSGVCKFVFVKLLEKMVVVDEFLFIMFNRYIKYVY